MNEREWEARACWCTNWIGPPKIHVKFIFKYTWVKRRRGTDKPKKALSKRHISSRSFGLCILIIQHPCYRILFSGTNSFPVTQKKYANFCFVIAQCTMYNIAFADFPMATRIFICCCCCLLLFWCSFGLILPAKTCNATSFHSLTQIHVDGCRPTIEWNILFQSSKKSLSQRFGPSFFFLFVFDSNDKNTKSH